jgi:ATP-binding cassette subfamily C protein
VRAAPGTAAASALTMIGLGLTEGVGLLCLIPLLGLVGVQSAGGTLGSIERTFAAGFAHLGLAPTLPAVLALYVLIAGGQTLAQSWQTRLGARLNQAFAARMRADLYQVIVGAQWSFLVRAQAAESAYILTQAVDRVTGAVLTLTSFLAGAVIAAAYMLLALRVSWTMTLLVLSAAAGLAWFARRRFRAAGEVGAELSAAATRLHTGVAEHLASLKTAKSYGQVGQHVGDFRTLVGRYEAASVGMAAAQAAFKQRLAFGLVLVLAVVVFIARDGLHIETAALLLLLVLFARLMPRITTLYEGAQYVHASMPMFVQILDFEARCRAAAEPAAPRSVPLPFTRGIRFDDVSFDYGAGAGPAVAHLTFDIEAGKTTAIVGPSGAGKSTIADLLLGLLSPQVGRVLVDGLELNAARLGSWRTAIGYVPQDAFLFHDTVRANLRWAKPDASEEQLWRALGLAQAEAFVKQLPAGLDTVLGDRGVLISGGERQRLSLARALLREPALLVLDEATSALDSENEARIHDALAELQHTVTIVIITHRLSTIRGADCIHVVDEGRNVESGSWEALSAARGRFLALLEAQGLGPTPSDTAIYAVQ